MSFLKPNGTMMEWQTLSIQNTLPYWRLGSSPSSATKLNKDR